MSFFSDDELCQLKRINELYQITQQLIYMSEELGDQNTFMPPINEIKDAFNHFMRIISAKFDSDKSKNQYAQINFEKIFSHLYRATFELFDYIYIFIRKDITESLQGISNEALTIIFSDYYKTIRPNIEDLIDKIPKYKNNKDIGDPNLEDVKQFFNSITDLRENQRKIHNILPSLIEYDIKEKKEKKDKQISQLFYDLIKVLIGFVLGLLSKRLF